MMLNFVDRPSTIAGAPSWMKACLLIAGAYNLAWGALVVFFPQEPFRWIGLAPPNYTSLWQCIGMIVGVYGVGYFVAAFDPARHWPIVLVGLLGKIFGPIGFVWSASRGELPWIAGWTIVTNDLLWWVPFMFILRYAYVSASTIVQEATHMNSQQ